MYKREDTPPPLMCIRRDNSTHLPSPRRRRHSNDRLQGNEMPITTNLDDMIDALDHDISRISVRRVSSGDTEATSTDSRTSPLSSQLLN